MDAFVHLASRGELDAVLVGHELDQLLTGQAIKLRRVVDSLTEALRAGAAQHVWDLARNLAATVLATTPASAGAPDLLTVAATAAANTHATDDLPEARTIAARHGNSRLINEATQLIRTIDDNRTA